MESKRVSSYSYLRNGGRNGSGGGGSSSEVDLDSQLLKISAAFGSAQTTTDLHKLIKTIDSTTAEIDKTLSQKTVIELRKLQHELSGIELSRAKLSSTTEVSSQLSKLFSSANDLGHTLTIKIKSLDLEINKVKDTLNFVTNIQLLKNNINQAFYALDHNDWETAAKCINTIKREVPEELINGEYASVVIPSTDIPELPAVTLSNWKAQLASTFQEKFTKAANDRDVPEMTKYFQLFPLIDNEEVGLACYSKFICLIIGDTLRLLIGSISGKQQMESTTGVYSSISLQLFESISMMLSHHGPLIKKYYGATYEGALIFVINKIQGEIDSQIGLVSDTFYDVRRIDKVIQDVGLYKFPLLSRRLREGVAEDQQHGEFNGYDDQELEIVSVVSVGDLMGELASILHFWSLYCKFITTKYIQPPQGAQTELKLPQLIESSNFTSKIQSKLLPSFEILAIYYFRRSIEKAISIEELPSLEPYLIATSTSTSPDQPPVSSVIDDTIFVLNTALRAIVDTSQPSAVKHFITEAYKIIHQDLLIGYIVKSLRENQPRYNSMLHLMQAPSTTTSLHQSPGNTRSSTPIPDSIGAGSFFKGATTALGSVVNSTTAGVKEQSPKLINFVLLLNTLAMGQEYFTKIIDNIVRSNPEFLMQNFPFNNDLSKIEKIFTNEFLDPFISSTNKLIQENLIVLYNQSIRQNLARLVNDFLPEVANSCLIYSSSSLNDPTIMIKISSSWQAMIRPYRQSFHKSLLFSKLLRLLVINLANLIEKKLMSVLEKFKVNELGALKLEKDLSFFISEVCEDNYDLREKFVRVTQLVLLVGMDDEEYDLSVQNIDNEGSEDDALGINWVLTPLERKKARQFRI